MAGDLGYVSTNVAHWAARRRSQLDLAQRAWAATEPRWGIFGVPERDAGLLPDDLDGRDVVELYAPDHAEISDAYGFVTPDWARRWPHEEVWRARRLA